MSPISSGSKAGVFGRQSSQSRAWACGRANLQGAQAGLLDITYGMSGVDIFVLFKIFVTFYNLSFD